jgi:diguanylate cyclase
MSTGPHLSLPAAMDLVAGLEQGELFLDYQPLLDLRTDRIASVEALLRWRHPTRGVLPPDAFLPQAQRSRMGPIITTFVLHAAVEQWLRWHRDGLTLRVAINVPPVELSDLTLVCELEDLLPTGFDPRCLVVEVTERRIADVRVIAPALERLRALGVRLSIDDFGTGESTLLRLQELEFDEIKIDRAFTSGVATSRAGRCIVRFVAELAHELGMTVVAEGVETEDDSSALRDLDVDLLQGYHVGRPGAPQLLEGHATA